MNAFLNNNNFVVLIPEKMVKEYENK